MSATIKIGGDIKGAMASLDTLETRLRKVSVVAADLFRKSSPQNQANLLKAYGIYTGTGGHILQPEQLLAQAARRSLAMGPLVVKPQTTLDPNLLAQGAKQLMSMGPLQTGGPNLRMAAMGAAVSLFSPWIGARMINESRLLRSMDRFFGGSGGKGGKGITGSLFGGSLEGFAEAYLLIRAMQLLRSAFNQLAEAAKRGADLYLHAAMVGTSPAKLSQLQKTFSLLGLPSEAAQRMLAAGQMRPGLKMSSAQFQGAVLGASGMLSREEMQALMNMSKSVASAWNMTLATARQSAGVATDLFRVSFVGRQLSEEWKTFWEQLSGTFSGAITIMEMSVTGLLHGVNALMELSIKFSNVLMSLPGFQLLGILGGMRRIAAAILPLDDPSKFTRRGLGISTSRPESAWEKMGLISSGGIGSADYARQTAQNTKRIADAVAGPGHHILPMPAKGQDWTGGVGHFGVPNMP